MNLQDDRTLWNDILPRPTFVDQDVALPSWILGLVVPNATVCVRLVDIVLEAHPVQVHIPIEISVANSGLKQLTLTRESFVLVDAEGNRYPAAGPKELLENYEFLDLDRRLQEIEGVTFNRFATYTIYPSKFSPTRRNPVRPGESSLVRDSITVPKFGYLIDFLYFPRPTQGVMGRKFELFMSAPELEHPVFVKFEVK